MSRNFKGLMYTAGIICIFILAAKLFFHMLPWLVAIGAGIYIFTKVRGKIQEKKANKTIKNSGYNSNMNTYSESQEYTSGDIIDVDYEEVDTNK